MNAARPRPVRRSKTSLRVRVRTWWIAGFFVLLLVLAGGYAFATWPGFRVQNVEVTGNAVESMRDVLARAAIPPDANVWLLNKGRIETQVATLPFIDTVHMHRGVPGSVRIEVTERKPADCLLAGGARYEIDEAERVLRLGCSAGLPVLQVTQLPAQRPGTFLHAPEVRRLLVDAEVLHKNGVLVKALSFDRFGGLQATTSDKILVKFGRDDDLKVKAVLVAPIFNATRDKIASMTAIDLRAPGTPVVVYR